MKLISFLTFSGLLFGAYSLINETHSVVWVTITSNIYTTFCPSNTKSPDGYISLSASISNYFTSEDCPCTLAQTANSLGTSTTTANSPGTSITAASTTPVNVIPLQSFNATSITRVWITVTETVSELTTYLPSPTELVHNLKTYTITKPTTLTISDCPCTISGIVPATIQTATTSLLTTHFTEATTVTLSGVTYPILSAGSTTIPFVQVSTVPIMSALSSYYMPTSSSILTLPPSKGIMSLPSSIIADSQPTKSFRPDQVEGNVAPNFNVRIGAIAAASFLLFFCSSVDSFEF